MNDAANGPLAGTRVVDLTRILAGPLCTMMLGDMGAEVIKVEPPDKGDDTRGWGPPFVAGEAAYFLGVNRNKRSLTLNMAVPAGQKILAGLVEKADVLIDNFRIGTLEKWGFTDAWFEQHAPRLVRCSITGYGSTGPKAALPGYDFILQAESGLMSICGEPDGGPDQIRRRDRRRLHRHARQQLHPRRAQRPPSHRQGPEGRALAVRDLARDAHQCRLELPDRGPQRRPLRQRPSQHRALHDLPGRRRDGRHRDRQRAPVRDASPRCWAIPNGRRMRASPATAPASRTAM